MATPQPPLTPEDRLAVEQKARYDRITRNLAIGGAIICPLIALMPPRKLDLYTFSLGVGFYLSADHLAQSYNGRPLYSQFSLGSPIRELPTEKAKETSRILKEREELERIKREGSTGKEVRRGMLGRLWMGDEEEGWKERRMEEEKKALQEGKSYGSIILDQIWEVWNWDKKNREGRAEEKSGDAPKKE
ncbi:hypothetical protein BU26DRAFT_517912 [Trematosphaeria pertusa]|uniref:Uncharacterized protein n=1 Tax=Trematosphaeria pertusa TaxID=390896 RepID=A0A6A6IL97_9PLEO|nr:uncharacterized protein BU26DRAFT_517912 [Trematosphaeria pertusa]KAF2251201.1 hypothetical protein BU26DRAFT_517912 [Trematosphaeria pertusa]